MSAVMKLDQVGRPAGVAGFARTDGLATGAVVSVTNVGGGSTMKVVLLAVPEGDTSALATLAAVSGTVWSFTPSVGKPGSFRIELIVDEGLATEDRQIRIFGIRTPNKALLVPAWNEVADPAGSLANDGPDVVDASENNEPSVSFPSGDPRGSFGALREAIMAIDSGGSEVIWKWPEVDATDFGVVYQGAGITSVALSRVLTARQKALRIHYVAGADDVFVIAFGKLTLPALDADKMRRWRFRMSIVGEPTGNPFGTGNMQMGVGIGNKLTGVNHFSATVALNGTGGSGTTLHRVDAGVLTTPGATPAGGGVGNWDGAFTSGFMGSHIVWDSLWNESEQGGGTKPRYGYNLRQEGNWQNPPVGTMGVDDTGIAAAFAAFPASWNDLPLTTLVIAIRSGAAGTYEIDLGDLEVLKHPMDL